MMRVDRSMIMRSLPIFFVIITGLDSSQLKHLNGEIDSTISFSCEIDQLPSNAIITWVYRPKTHKQNGIRWLPLYANARRLTQNNPRFIVDYTGYDERTKKSISVLTIHQLRSSDEGLYMCKSNQYQSIASLFNLTLSPSMEIYPKEALVPLDSIPSFINLSCTVREVSSQPIDPTRIKWYQNDKELETIYFIDRYSHRNQATSIVSIPSWSLNDETDLFKCLYENGKISKAIRIVTSSSLVFDYSKSTATRLISSCLSIGLMSIFMQR